MVTAPTNAPGRAEPLTTPGRTRAEDTGTSDRAALAEVARAIVGCHRCPRLRTYCSRIAAEKKAAYRDETYWGRPVPGFGDPQARVLIVGLAPAAHGANRTGRLFTGDGSGDFLMRALHDTGFANQPTSRREGDGLALAGAYIAAAVRCAPPNNRPTPKEIAACRPHLAAELAALPRVAVLVALGRIAFDACLALIALHTTLKSPRLTFAHGRLYAFGEKK